MSKKSTTKENAKAAPTTQSAKSTKAKAAKKASAKSTAKKPGQDSKPKRLSALDAAAQLLAKRGEAMRTGEMIATMAEQGLWSSPHGKTPAATLYSAILREIEVKGTGARFRKVERGKFESTGRGA